MIISHTLRHGLDHIITFNIITNEISLIPMPLHSATTFLSWKGVKIKSRSNRHDLVWSSDKERSSGVFQEHIWITTFWLDVRTVSMGNISYYKSNIWVSWSSQTTFTFTFMHLADAFIQSDLQCIQAIHFFVSTVQTKRHQWTNVAIVSL